MALITDKNTREMLNDRLKEFSNFGMVLYYLLEEEKIDLKIISDVFFSKDEDKAVIMYLKLMKMIKPKDIDKAFIKYSEITPNIEDFDIDTYKEYLNVLYTSKIIDKIACNNNFNVDKTYINTYNYLIENTKLFNLAVENR